MSKKCQKNVKAKRLSPLPSQEMTPDCCILRYIQSGVISAAWDLSSMVNLAFCGISDVWSSKRTHSETQFICSIPHERGALLRWNHSMKKAIALTRHSVRAVRFSPVHWYHPFWLQYSTINLKWQDGKLYKTNSFRWCNSMNSMCGHWQPCENLIYLFCKIVVKILCHNFFRMGRKFTEN